MKVMSFIIQDAIPFINKASTKIDQALNVVTACPIIGGLGAVGRFKYGNAQVVSGIAIAIFSSLAIACSSKQETRNQWKKVAVFGSEYAIHGALNIFKSLGELLLSVCTYTLANPILLINRIPNNFNPSFKYGEFSESYKA